jgi:hypothetical protein
MPENKKEEKKEERERKEIKFILISEYAASMGLTWEPEDEEELATKAKEHLGEDYEPADGKMLTFDSLPVDYDLNSLEEILALDRFVYEQSVIVQILHDKKIKRPSEDS